jgi:tetratricopeptide (TPR) repeat protein
VDRQTYVREGRRRLISMVALCLGVVMLGACQSPPRQNPMSARARLEPLLEAWESARSEGGGCEQRGAMETPIIDCEPISKEIIRLAIEFPHQPDVLLAAAVVAFEGGRQEDALKTLDVLRSHEPIHPKAAMLRTQIAIDEGNLRFAQRLLDEQRELTPDHPGLRELLASVAYLQGEYAQADRSLEIARQLGAPAWRVAYHRGLIAEASDRPERAAQAYAECLETAPDFAPARSRLRALVVTNGELSETTQAVY